MVARWLREQGHDVASVFDEARGATDDDVLQRAFREHWILVTNDKDFGDKVFRERLGHHGILLLRLRDQRPQSKIEAVRMVLEQYADRLADGFVVVSEGHVRFAQ